MIARLLRSVAISFMALLASKAIIDGIGLGETVEQQADRWLLPLFVPILTVLLFLLLVAYFFCRRPRSHWVKDAVVGMVAGLLAGPLAVVVAGSMESGIQGLIRGFRDAGFVYPLILIGGALFPLVSWLYGGVAAVCGGLLERYLIRRLERRIVHSALCVKKEHSKY